MAGLQKEGWAWLVPLLFDNKFLQLHLRRKILR